MVGGSCSGSPTKINLFTWYCRGMMQSSSFAWEAYVGNHKGKGRRHIEFHDRIYMYRSSFTHFMMIKIKGIKDIVEHFGLCLSIHRRLSLHLSVNLLPCVLFPHKKIPDLHDFPMNNLQNNEYLTSSTMTQSKTGFPLPALCLNKSEIKCCPKAESVPHTTVALCRIARLRLFSSVLDKETSCNIRKANGPHHSSEQKTIIIQYLHFISSKNSKVLHVKVKCHQVSSSLHVEEYIFAIFLYTFHPRIPCMKFVCNIGIG